MKIVKTTPSTFFGTAKKILFACRNDGTLFRLTENDEIRESFFFDMGGDYYMPKCPTCDRHVTVAVPLYKGEEVMYDYILDLEAYVSEIEKRSK